MESIIIIYQNAQEIIKENPVVAGAVSLWGLTILTFIIKEVPRKIYRFLFNQITTSLSFNNSNSAANDLNYTSFMQWYKSTTFIRFSRSLSLETKTWEGESVIGPGEGNHFFFYMKRLFWFKLNRLESSGTNLEKREIVIKTLGRNQTVLDSLVSNFKYKNDDDELMSIFIPSSEGWNRITKVEKRKLSSTIINPSIKDKIIKDLDFLFNNKDWYVNRGLPYKKTIIFHGPPGTGKSSLISSLASHYKKNLCLMDITSLKGSAFQKLLLNIPKNSFVAIEDFDTATTKARKSYFHSLTELEEKEEGVAVKDEDSLMANFMNAVNDISLTTILNTLDGVVRLNDVVIFMTTNHLENIDPAVLRKGRVDHIYKIEYLKHNEIVDYINLMYKDTNFILDENIRFGEIAGCNIQDLFMEHKEDFNSFIASLPIVKTN